ncbi:MAG TPA: tetratricopeptide repeat protein, partial [Saprospiraceae bacterium]|nr:tetratricopeptide repeat protein [Saprospiraceae bacterium]
MIKFNLVLIIGMFCSLSFSYSQNYITEKTASPKLREEYNEGYKLIQKEDYLKAAKVFSNVLKKEPRFLDAHIQLGLCLEKTKSIDGAIEAYKNALKIDTLYYPRVLYLLAVQLKKKEFYSDAIYLLDRYISISKASPEALAYAKRIKEVCQIYLLSKEEGYVFKPENLGPSINTQNLEYLPCLTVDGETLIFTRRIGEAEDFYFSNIVGNKWSIAKPIIGLNTPGNEGAETISADGKTIVFTGCKYPDSKGGCDLYISHLKNGNWTKPINMGSPINTEAWESEPSLSADGNIIYFSSDRKGGFGGSDIYVSYKTENEKWSKPVPLPKPINNEYNTESAFMHPDGKTLYFRCQGLPGLGGYDLYISRLNDMNVWSEPLNMGVGINTERDEGALII